MKLLIFTQKVNKNDPILGFFHRWIEEFSKYCESVLVICLEKGEYNLPKNVEILSLGKEEGVSRIKYIYRFYKYIFSRKNDYDKVFVHMNSEYVVLGGLVWNSFNKNISLWHNHKVGNLITVIAAKITNNIFYTSKYAFCSRYKKAIQMPIGIDTNLFNLSMENKPKNNTILYAGRISPVKNIITLIKALKELKKRGIVLYTTVIGDPTANDKKYFNKVRQEALNLEEQKLITFKKGVSNEDLVNYIQDNKYIVNMTNSGSYDKVILEGMSSGSIPIVANKNLKIILPEEMIFEESDSNDLANKIEVLIKTQRINTSEFRNWVVKNHDIKLLIRELISNV